MSEPSETDVDSHLHFSSSVFEAFEHIVCEPMLTESYHLETPDATTTNKVQCSKNT